MEKEWLRKEELKEKIDRIAGRTMDMDLPWDWSCGVAYYGICRAWEATEDERILEPVRRRVELFLELGLPEAWTVNKCAMGHCLITLYEAFGEQKYMDLIDSKLDYLSHHAPRFGDGVLQHTVSSQDDFPEQCWADTLFMAAYFMLRAGVLKKDEGLIKDALSQYEGHIRFLQDEESGLWYHGYDNQSGGHMSGFYWARANAWAAYTMAQAGKCIPKSYLYPECMDIAGSLAELLSALKRLQTENGLWRTVLDDGESYEETSASCGIAAAMAVRGNILHRPCVQRAYEGFAEKVAPDGRVLGVSGGTAVMRDLDGYRNIPRKWIQGWGQGLGLAFLAALYTL